MSISAAATRVTIVENAIKELKRLGETPTVKKLSEFTGISRNTLYGYQPVRFLVLSRKMAPDATPTNANYRIIVKSKYLVSATIRNRIQNEGFICLHDPITYVKVFSARFVPGRKGKAATLKKLPHAEPGTSLDNALKGCVNFLLTKGKSYV